MATVKSDIEIAQSVEAKSIIEIAKKLSEEYLKKAEQ